MFPSKNPDMAQIVVAGGGGHIRIVALPNPRVAQAPLWNSRLAQIKTIDFPHSFPTMTPMSPGN